MTFKEAKVKSHEAKQLCEDGKYADAAKLYGEIVDKLEDDPGGWRTYWQVLYNHCVKFAESEKK